MIYGIERSDGSIGELVVVARLIVVVEVSVEGRLLDEQRTEGTGQGSLQVQVACNFSDEALQRALLADEGE